MKMQFEQGTLSKVWGNKTMHYTVLILAMLSLFIIFNQTYPLIAQEKATHKNIFSGKVKRVGDKLVIVARA